jgi:hypothetical protein
MPELCTGAAQYGNAGTRAVSGHVQVVRFW